MSEEELAALEAIAAEASPGPWCIGERHWSSDRSEAGIMVVADVPDEWAGEEDDLEGLEDAEEEIAGVMWVKDARFICRARDAIPQLIAEIRRLRAERG